MSLTVNLEIPYVSIDGYGHVSSCMIRFLNKAGASLLMDRLQVRFCPIGFINIETMDIAQKAFMANNPKKHGDVTLAIGQPNIPMIRRENKPLAVLTMWETDTIPHIHVDWARNLNTADLCIVPCTKNKEVFEKCGVKIPIEVIPLGVENEYIEKTESYDDSFKYGFLASNAINDHRKNWLGVKAAYDKVRKPNTELLVKTKFGFIQHHLPNYNDAIIIEGEAERDWIFESFYDRVNCFLFPTRGEGFGLPPLEAMARGRVAIVSGGTGGDYIEEGMCKVLDYDVVPVDFLGDWSYNPGVKASQIGNWVNPDIEQLKQYMSDTYYDWKHNDNNENDKLGSKACKRIKENYTFEQTAERTLKVLEKLVGGYYG
jgi:glycosyltransferase involved in cell wall biosynthesis